MALRLMVATCMLVLGPCLCRAQQAVVIPVPNAYYLPRGAAGSVISPGMFGTRVLGQSLVAGNRTFARGPMSLQIRQAAPFVPLSSGQIPAAAPVAQTAPVRAITPQPAAAMEPGTIPIPNTRPVVDAANAGRARPRPAPRRAAYRAAIDYPSPAAAEVQSQLATNLQNIVGSAGLPPIQVAVQDHTVVLRGSVATAHNRDLAAALALLEAGVDQVQNELTVAQPVARAETPTRPAE